MAGGTTLAIDIHVHSERSYDGHEPAELILEHASDIGLDGVVITDHDTVVESRYAAEVAGEYGLVGVPGVEVSTSEGHLLAIGVTERPDPGRPFAETAAEVRDLGGAVVVPHPFQRSRHGIRRRNLDEDTPLDAVEAYNSMLFTGYRNRRARKFAEAFDYPAVGGSDAHYLPNVGRAYTEIEVDADREACTAADVVAAIRRGETSIHGKRTPIRRSARQYAVGALRKGVYELTSRAPFVPAYPASMSTPWE
ncbi:MAG: CehA/McbA family metallohydrolase [Haloarculaceae archaeon]